MAYHYITATTTMIMVVYLRSPSVTVTTTCCYPLDTYELVCVCIYMSLHVAASTIEVTISRHSYYSYNNDMQPYNLLYQCLFRWFKIMSVQVVFIYVLLLVCYCYCFCCLSSFNQHFFLVC